MQIHFDVKRISRAALEEEPTRAEMNQVAAIVRQGGMPAPCILKPKPMWTGKQIMSWILPSALTFDKVVRKGNRIDWSAHAEECTLPSV